MRLLLTLPFLYFLACDGQVSIKDGSTQSAGDADTDTDADSDVDSDSDSDTDPTEPQSSDCLQPFIACGGDPTGAWQISSYCVDGVATNGTAVYPDYNCPGATLTTETTVAGTFDLASTGRYSVGVSATGTFTYDIPSACLDGYSCGDIVESVGANECNPNGGGCLCTGDIPEYYDYGSAESGDWTTDGTALILVDDAYGNATDLDFCVDGNVLRLFDPAENVDLGLVR